jgi:YVTN family beta-propeller protein
MEGTDIDRDRTLDRRRLLAAGGAVGVGAWVAPSIVSAPAASAATVAPPCVRGVVGTVTSGPLARHVAVTATHAYVSRSPDSIQVVDLATATQSGTIDLGLGFPAGGDVAILGTDLYVAIPGGVRIYDLVTETLTGEIPIVTPILELAVDAASCYVTHGSDAPTVEIIDLGTMAVGAPIMTGVEPHGVAVTPTGAIVANSGSGTVSIIDAATNSVTDTIAVGASPESVATTATRAYVVNFVDATVSIIDLATNAVVDTVVLGPSGSIRGVAATPTHAYFANTEAGVVVLDAATNAITETIPAGDFPWAIATNGTHLAIADPNYGRTTIVDLCTETPPP